MQTATGRLLCRHGTAFYHTSKQSIGGVRYIQNTTDAKIATSLKKKIQLVQNEAFIFPDQNSNPMAHFFYGSAVV